ncbi:MAG: hypothetical protein CMJ78_07815, partial [Planctomycetaceae bacterium]|nr:hypothetical protein [Planctomycetaceae bacterium]
MARGGSGNDDIQGGLGDDRLIGQRGVDTVSGGDGDDRVEGSEDGDSLLGGAGNDTLVGNAGNDSMLGGDGDDSLVGGAGRDAINGGVGNDTGLGQGGADTIVGGGGSDSIRGDAGNDRLSSLDEGSLQLSIDDLAITEGATGTFNVQFTLTLDRVATVTSSVRFTTVAGTASEGADFLANSGTVVFNPGDTTRTIDVQIVNDDVVETEEAFSVLLSNPVNLRLADQQGDAIITDNDVELTQETSDGTIDATRTVTLTDSLNGVPTLPDNTQYVSPDALGDFDNDGIPDLVVSAIPGVDNPGNVYVHLMNSDGTVRTTETFTINSPDFGSDVAAIGDLNGDGVVDLVVGSDCADDCFGAVFIVFMNADGTMQSNTKIGTNMNGGPPLRDDDLFGTSVA